MIKSPINYTGCKYKLLKDILPLFPKDINVFIDAFGGSGTVSLNVSANKIICNDIIPYISDMFNTWKTMSLEDILSYYNQYTNISEKQFLELRNQFNETRDSKILFVLICNSFNAQMRFNNKQEYNSSCSKGVRYLNPNILHNLELTYPLLKNIEFVTNDFRELDYFSLTNTNDFVYFDPPYLLNNGVYQDGKRGFKGWSKEDDLDLMHLCDKLTKNNIMFAMSNIFSSKGQYNEDLIRWSNKYIVKHLNIEYYLGARKERDFKDDEVLIRNYV